MTLKAFIDESGKGDPLIFVMAGFIARAEEWAKFSDDWNAALQKPPSLEYFHMADAVARKDFERIGVMAAIIRKYKFPALAITVLMEDYNAIINGRINRRLDNPYFLGYHSIMELALEWEIEHGINEPIDFIFDEQHAESDYLQSIFTPLLDAQPPEIRARFGNRPIHLDDKKSPPLQAADMFAWPFRRVAERARFRIPVDNFLLEIFQGVTVRRQEWDRAKLAEFLNVARQRNRQEWRLFTYEFDAATRNKDKIYHQFNQACLEKAVSGQTIPLLSIPAKGMGRFLLVHKCPLSSTPHLHRRSGDRCLAHLEK